MPKKKAEFPDKVPFWARLKISKNRPTLVIDRAMAIDKKKKKEVEGFVHREVTHTERKDAEKIVPNPNKVDPNPMYLKNQARKHPKKMFVPHNKDWEIPKHLQEKYEKNNIDK